MKPAFDPPDIEPVYHRGIDGGWYNEQGQPVTAAGKPDWCGNCGRVRVVYERGVSTGRCASCGEREKDERKHAAREAMANDPTGLVARRRT